MRRECYYCKKMADSPSTLVVQSYSESRKELGTENVDNEYLAYFCNDTECENLFMARLEELDARCVDADICTALQNDEMREAEDVDGVIEW